MMRIQKFRKNGLLGRGDVGRRGGSRGRLAGAAGRSEERTGGSGDEGGDFDEFHGGSLVAVETDVVRLVPTLTDGTSRAS